MEVSDSTMPDIESLEIQTSKSIERKRRTRVPEKPIHQLNVWSLVKNCIGKDLTRIPLPVNFSEPLSMLQRICEDLHYSDILDKAADCSDSCEQLAYVAAFAVSCYQNTSVRTAKPFNPLLGETFECDRREEAGWRVISEQVSHHPPVTAQHCEGRRWLYHQEFAVTSKLKVDLSLACRVEATPDGVVHLKFPESGNHYTFSRKVKTDVHNIVMGKLFIEHRGEMHIINHKTGDKCVVTFVPKTSEVERKVTGSVMNSTGEDVWSLNGTWDHMMEGSKVLRKDGKQLQMEPPQVLWLRKLPPSESNKMYNFSEFACQLNELEDGVAPTDSRLRPDLRQMEDGDWDAANATKCRLEEKQRATRTIREREMEVAKKEGRPVSDYEPTWFTKEKDPTTSKTVHIFKGHYWAYKDRQDWSPCPDIFSLTESTKE